MRFNFAAGAVATALLVGNVYADEAQKVLADEGSSPADPKASSPVTPDMPTFTVSNCPLLSIVFHLYIGQWHAAIRLVVGAEVLKLVLTLINQTAYQVEGSVLGAVHRRLGEAVEAFACEEGHQGL